MRFDPADGNKPTQTIVKTGTLSLPPENNPVRDGFRFDGWTRDGLPFDFQTPVLQDTTLKAKWTKTQDWTLNPDHGPASGARLTVNPPNRREPQFASFQTSGDQIVGLTGDGRIYTWTEDSTPKQIPFPAQAPDGFHYLQVAAGSRWQAALGSDQHIYTWANGQTTPTIFDTGQNTKFTSISMNDDRLLAVNQQGHVHTFQDSQKDRRNPKPNGQETTSLPGKAQAVTAVASASRILALDSDGQAWTWDASNTGKAKPARIKQDPGTRIVQAQALNPGLLLLDTDGHTYYLANDTTSIVTVGLPEGMRASRITANKNQAMIVGKDGHVWAWKPGEAPKRADNGNQLYVQAASTGSRITAFSTKGGMFTWSLDGRGQPGRPVRLDTSQVSILESASMDGQPLKINRNNGSWQTEPPAHKPGEAIITIAGRQDGQPFTRSLKYTVDQTLTRDVQQSPTYQVTFNAAGGSPKPGDQQISDPKEKVKRPSPDPVREGYLFDGWFTGQVAYDFNRPVTKDLNLTAHWTFKDPNNRWRINPSKGSQLGNETTVITPPTSHNGIKFSQVSTGRDSEKSFSLAVGSDGNAYAWGYNSKGRLGDGTTSQRNTPVRVKTPDRNTYPDLPKDFTYVQVSAGGTHSLAVGSDGNAYAWGWNKGGELGDGTTTERHTPVRVRTPDRKTYPDLPKDFTYVQVSAGEEYSLAVGSDGYAYAWGNNSIGELGNGSNYSSSSSPLRVRDPASPDDRNKGLKAIQVSAGIFHSLAVGSDGYAYAWGYNSKGQLGNGISGSYADSSFPVRVCDPADTSKGLKVIQVSAGEYSGIDSEFSLAVGSDGYAYAWGDNYDGELGNGDSGPYADSSFPVRVRDPASAKDKNKGLKAMQVSAGTTCSLAVGSDGNAYAWGDNLGNNTTGSSSVPVHVRNPANPTDTSKGLQAVQVSVGGNHSLVVGSDGNAYAWGDNNGGQLGNDSIPAGEYINARSLVPVPVSFNLTPVITGVRFDQTPVAGLTRGDGNSVTVTTPAHQPGTVTVSVDYTLGGAPQTPDTSLKYTYLPAGVLPRAGGEGILLALATGMTGMGGVLASRRHRREQHQLVHASHE